MAIISMAKTRCIDMKAKLFALLLLPMALGYLGHGDEVSRVEDQPDLAQIQSWRPELGSENILQLDQWTRALSVNISFDHGKSARLMLKNSLVIPDWATDFHFVVGNNGLSPDIEMRFRLIIQDSNGNEFLYKLSSPHFPNSRRSTYLPGHFRGRPLEVNTPGLGRPVLTNAGNNIEAKTGGNVLPKGPLRITGIQIDELSQKEGPPFSLYLDDFVFTMLTPAGSDLYYALDDEEKFGALDSVPSISLGRLGPVSPGKFVVSWDVRDRYDGQPFLTGGEQDTVDARDSQYALAFQKKIEFPVRDRGTY